MTVVETFDEQYLVNPETGCYVWRRAKTHDGYGRFTFRGKQYLAHRHAYSRLFGAIPDAREVCHTCDNPACVNPGHLFLGTHLDNMRDSQRKGRVYKARGPLHYGAILNEHQVRAIRAQHAAAVRPCDIARAFGVSPQLVYRITSRRIWAHVRP